MRRLPLVLLALLAACGSLPKTVDPRLQISPYYAAYQLRGKVAMQSDPGSGPIDHRAQSLRNLGQDHFEDDFGIRADFGDGMSGLRLDWYRLTMNPTDVGVLDDDFGHLLASDVVMTSATMNEFRLGYLQEVWTTRASMREHPLDLKVAVGAVLAHRDLALHAREINLARTQDLGISDNGVIYPAARFRAGWQALTWDLEYAISPDLNLGGDFKGVMQDLETRLTYTVPFQDVGVFVGYRWSTLPIDGKEGGLGFDGDLRIDGIQLGVVVSF